MSKFYEKKCSQNEIPTHFQSIKDKASKGMVIKASLPHVLNKHFLKNLGVKLKEPWLGMEFV